MAKKKTTKKKRVSVAKVLNPEGTVEKEYHVEDHGNAFKDKAEVYAATHRGWTVEVS